MTIMCTSILHQLPHLLCLTMIRATRLQRRLQRERGRPTRMLRLWLNSKSTCGLKKAKMDKQQLARELAEAKKENQRLAKRLQKAENQHHELPRARSPAAHSVNSSSSDSGVAPMIDADFPRNAADKATSSSAAKKRKEAPLSALPSLVNSSSKAARTLLADSAGKENRTAQEEAVQKLGALATELMHERSNQHLEAELLKARAAEYAAEQHALQSELELVHLLERVAGGSM